MSESDKVTEQVATEVKGLLIRLRASQGNQRREAAAELGSLGVRTWGSVVTRGSMDRAAQNRLPEPERLIDLLEYLGDPEPEVRCQVAAAIGEWGCEEAVQALNRRLESDLNEDVQLCCITALQKIGGPIALEGLRYGLEKGSDAVRGAAISAIEELATGGTGDYTGNPIPDDATLVPSVRQGRPVAVLGALRTGDPGPIRAKSISARIVDCLKGLCKDPKASEDLKLRAGEAIALLTVNPREPLDCAAVESLLGAFVRGTLTGEQRGRLEWHLDSCEECAAALGQQIAEGIAAGEILQPAKVRREPVLVKPWRARSIVSWHGHRVPEPVLRGWGYHRALQSAALRRGVAMSGVDKDSVRIQVLDASLSVVSGGIVHGGVIEPPYFTNEGGFRMTLWLEDEDAEHYIGYSAVCVLKLDDVSLAFESRVGGSEVPFRADGLPTLEGDGVILLQADTFDYFLAPGPLSPPAI